MDEAVIKELNEVVKGLQKIRKETWGPSETDKRLLPLDEEIAVLEDLIGQMTYKGGWNGSHPIGMT